VMMSLTRSIRKGLSASVFAFIAMTTVCAIAPTAAVAQDAEAVEGRQFSSKAGEIVNAANEFVTANQYQAAINKLNEALAP